MVGWHLGAALTSLFFLEWQNVDSIYTHTHPYISQTPLQVRFWMRTDAPW